MKNQNIKYLDPFVADRVRFWSEQEAKLDVAASNIVQMPTSEEKGRFIAENEHMREEMRLFYNGLKLEPRAIQLDASEVKVLVSFILKQKNQHDPFVFLLENGKLRRSHMDAKDRVEVVEALRFFSDIHFTGTISIKNWKSPDLVEVVMSPKHSKRPTERTYEKVAGLMR